MIRVYDSSLKSFIVKTKQSIDKIKHPVLFGVKVLHVLNSKQIV